MYVVLIDSAKLNTTCALTVNSYGLLNVLLVQMYSFTFLPLFLIQFSIKMCTNLVHLVFVQDIDCFNQQVTLHVSVEQSGSQKQYNGKVFLFFLYFLFKYLFMKYSLRALSHKATFTGNFEATNCSACYRTTLVAHGSVLQHCLTIHKSNLGKQSNVNAFSSWRLPGTGCL